MSKAYLILSNEKIFEGVSIGADRDTLGEIVFTTGVEGYVETLTDPSYCGQIITQTFPLIGNYGVASADFEGGTFSRGYVVRELCQAPSNFRSEYSLGEFLKARDIPGIAGIDTRALTRILREEGVMNAAIVRDPRSVDMDRLRSYRIEGAVEEAGRKTPETFEARGDERYLVALIDYGAKMNIIRCLQRRGCRVIALPYSVSAEEVLSLHPDGVMLSNGPGNPEDNTFAIAQIERLIGKIPIFGICLGHQLTALAMGGRTIKLKYGHHGANQPVKAVEGSRCFITSQNHNYAVVRESLTDKGREIFYNANDLSNEGISYPGLKCFTVQFHPEAAGGPQDTEFLFEGFISMMREAQRA